MSHAQTVENSKIEKIKNLRKREKGFKTEVPASDFLSLLMFLF